MLRFGNRRAAPARRTLSSQGRSVWLLLLMLGAVLALVRQLKQPAAVGALGRIFSSPAAEDAGAEAQIQAEHPVPPAMPPRLVDTSTPSWAAVKDNAIFSSAEQTAWFELIEQARRLSTDELERQSVGDVTYAQLVNQPDAYRGRSVRVRGRVLRASAKRAPENSLGLKEYFQLFLAPAGGGSWPMVVYCVDLPSGFPRGDGLKEDLVIDGLFFKNWSYPFEGGMGLAPALTAPTIRWQPAQNLTAEDSKPLDVRVLLAAAGAAGLVALVFIGWVARQTRRSAAGQRSQLPKKLGLETEP